MSRVFACRETAIVRIKLMFLAWRKLAIYLNLMIAGSVSLLSAAVTPEQLHRALGAQTGLVWTVGAEHADAWRLSADQILLLSNYTPGEIFFLQTTVNGPGVLEIKLSMTYDAFEGSIWVNDLKYGSDFTRYLPSCRVQVGAGQSTIRWEFIRRPIANSSNPYATVEIPSATWDSFSALPLSTMSDSGVVLSGPWIDQDGWHYGDGRAAWSGIVQTTPSGTTLPPQVLVGKFAGPGVFSFANRIRGDSARFTLDGKSLPLKKAEWSRNFYLVGPGNHLANWEIIRDSTNQNELKDTDMVIDEVNISNEVDATTALDLPGRLWNLTAGSQQAFGAEVVDAFNGSALVMPAESQIWSRFNQPGLLKIRKLPVNSPSFYFIINNRRTTPVWIGSAGRSTGRNWRELAVEIPNGGATLSIVNQSETTLVDHFEWLPTPITLHSALNLKANAFTVGGNSPWTVATFPSAGGFGIETLLADSSKIAWLDFPVNGPVKMEMEYNNFSSYSTVSFLLDGQTLPTEFSNSRDQIRIEIPAGQHTLRMSVSRDPKYGNSPWRKFEVGISKIRITPLNAGEEISEALDYGGPWLSNGDWKFAKDITHDGVDSLQPQPPQGISPNETSHQYLARNFEGPGYLKFWTYYAAPLLEVSFARISWSSTFGVEGSRNRFQEGSQWQETSLWVPAGSHSVQWKTTGLSRELIQLALDEVSFVHSSELAIDTAFSDSRIIWENPDSTPWTGVKKSPQDSPIIVSPIVRYQEPASLSAYVQGPGTLSFRWNTAGSNDVRGSFRINGVQSDYRISPSDGERFDTIVFPAGPASKVEWIAESSRPGWLELGSLKWRPWPESSLATALDTPRSVTWTTSQSIPFTGRPIENSHRGTAAYVALKPGEETWLRATMNGPGVFDFWLIEAPGGARPWFYHVDWEVEVDGKKIEIHGPQWDPIWITGAGPHQIKLKFRNSSDFTLAGAVDQASWKPLFPRRDSSLTSSSPSVLESFARGGRDNARVSNLNVERGQIGWIEYTVRGPGLLEWDQKAGYAYRYFGQEDLKVELNGICILPISASETWQRCRLSIPSGVHKIRWSSNLRPAWEGDDLNPPLPYNRFWQISGIRMARGIPAIVEALDLPNAAWLTVGEGRGTLVTAAWDGVDAWRLGDNTALYLCNISPLVLRLQGKVLEGEPPFWKSEEKRALPGEALGWAIKIVHEEEPLQPSVIIDGVTADSLVAVPLPVALDLAIGATFISESGWVGVNSAVDSTDQADAAWSRLDQAHTVRKISIAAAGPAKIRFKWKKTGSGNFRLLLNGGVLPVAPATSEWNEVEVDVSGSENFLQWEHWNAWNANNIYSSGDAWLDQVSVIPLNVWSLDQAAASGVALGLMNASPTAGVGNWEALASQDVGGEAVFAARCVAVAGAMSLSVTGPRVVSFRGRCFGWDVNLANPARVKTSNSLAITDNIGGWDSPTPLGHQLSLYLNGKVKAAIPLRTDIMWSDASIFVPEGNHTLTWQLDTKFSNFMFFSSDYLAPATDPELQAWVQNIRIETPRLRYTKWAREHRLATSSNSPNDDADGDGSSNLLEYGHGSDPNDNHSRPAQVSGAIASREPFFFEPEGEGRQSYFDLSVPYLSPFVMGSLESSVDLISWKTRNEELLTSMPEWRNPFSSAPASTETHQVIAIPLADGDAKLYFRVKISLPGD